MINRFLTFLKIIKRFLALKKIINRFLTFIKTINRFLTFVHKQIEKCFRNFFVLFADLNNVLRAPPPVLITYNNNCIYILNYH